ncbi:MAG: DUF2103 domain-containing protein [Firmicutes bacterium]|nr:DUF2103 domain-containing protein [Bacillota bacterium]
MTKYRHSKIKRKHHVLKEIEPGLHFLSSHPAVDGVIPGIISPKSGGFIGWTFQYLTPSGFKLIGRSSGAAQELFVITAQPILVIDALCTAGWLSKWPDGVPHPPSSS